MQRIQTLITFIDSGCCRKLACDNLRQDNRTTTRTPDALLLRILFCLGILRNSLRTDLATARHGAVWSNYCAFFDRNRARHDQHLA